MACDSMDIQNACDLQATREKMRLLQEHYQARLDESSENQRSRELSLQSLKKMINQLTEEILRYEAHAGQRAR